MWAAPIVVVKKENGKSPGICWLLDWFEWVFGYTSVIHFWCQWIFSQIWMAEFALQKLIFLMFFFTGSWWESKEHLTINPHEGLFRFNHLIFGVRPTPDNGHYIDRSCRIHWWHHITGAPQGGLLQHLFSVFKQIQQYGFCVKAKKHEFFSWKQINYLGFIFNKNGRWPDQENILAIK